jgi:hypothetical protein
MASVTNFVLDEVIKKMMLEFSYFTSILAENEKFTASGVF